MTEEIWKDILGFEGRYQVSNRGRVKSLPHRIHSRGRVWVSKERILRPGRANQSGHLSVSLGTEKNGVKVHKLVAETFLGLAPAGKEVRHLNGDPSDNRLENLKYGTRRENILDDYANGISRGKLNLADVERIRTRLSAGASGRSIAQEFNVNETTVSRIKLGRTFAWHQKPL